MIQWRLDDDSLYSDFDFVDKGDSNTFHLEIGDYDIDAKIIDNSLMDGSQEVSNRRVESPKPTMTADISYENTTDFRTFVNSLLAAFYRSIYIEDTEDDTRIKVVPTRARVSYEKGARNHYGKIDLRWNAINAAVESRTQSTDTQNTTASVQLNYNIDAGDKQNTVVMELDAAAACNSITIVNVTNGETLIIQDPLFGTTADTLIIDNTEGTLMLGAIDRKEYIVDGTSFFRLEPGTNELQITTAAACNVETRWYKRYWF